MIKGTYRLPDFVRDRLKPPTRLTVSEWADKHRRLHEKYCAEPGPWNTSRVPYLREIMDTLVDPKVGSVIFIKCSRIGGTEAMYNQILYSMSHQAVPTLFVMPKESDINEEFKGRLMESIKACGDVYRFATAPNWSTQDTVTLDSMDLYGAWASAPDTLIRRTCGRVFFDEVDNCQSQAGRLGQTWDLAQERTATYKYRGKQVGVTTPSVVDAAGWKAWLSSDQRLYWVPCPECGGYQTLVLSGLEWPGDATPDEIESETLAQYKCSHCHEFIDPWMQKWMVDRGVWVPKAQAVTAWDQPQNIDPGDRPTIEGDDPYNRRRGYRINALYSPWRSWGLIASKYLRSKKDPEAYRVFKNAWMAEPWEHAAASPDASWLNPKIQKAKNKRSVLPPDTRVILAGADVQMDRLYYTARAYGSGGSRLIEAGMVKTFEDLYDVLFVRGWPFEHDPTLWATCFSLNIDSGFRTDEVYAFAEKTGINAVKGWERLAKPVDYSPIKSKRTQPKDAQWVWNINTTLFKSKLARLMKDPSDEWQLHEAVDPEYVTQMTSEHFVREGRKWVWRQKVAGNANHWFDCEVYLLALTEMLSQSGEIDVHTIKDTDATRRSFSSKASKAQPVRRTRPKRSVRGGWNDVTPR